MNMNLYISGMHYGSFDPFCKEPEYAVLDVWSGKIQPAKKLDEKEFASFRALTKFRLAELADHLAEASEKLKGLPESFEMSDGTRYEKKDEHNYVQRNIKFPEDLIVDGEQIVGIQTIFSYASTILIQEGYENLTVLPLWDELYTDIHAVNKPMTVMVPMRDGVKLALDVLLPADAEGPLSTVLVRTPYNREDTIPTWIRFAQRGFAVAIEDTRGRNESEGEWSPMHYEIEDGDDTLSFIAEQPWSNGRVGMIGGSYLGYVQWAAAASKNPHLKAICSQVAAGSPFADSPRHGGGFSSGMLAWGFAMAEKRINAAAMARDDWDVVLAHRPLEEIYTKFMGTDLPYWKEWLKHPVDDEFWKAGDWFAKCLENGGTDVPSLIQTGWFDDDGMGSTQALDLTENYAHGQRKVIMGPWIHGGNTSYDVHNVSMGQNALRYDIDVWHFRWFEKYLNGRDCIPADSANVEYFTIGQDSWKTSEKWPPEYSEKFTLKLSANGVLTNGAAESGADSFTYDPLNPATHIIDMSENEIQVPEDYTEEEKRSDYLIYTTEPLKEDWTFTGDANVRLYLSSDCPDTDLMVRITRVDENGKSIKFSDGYLDVKFREGFDKEVFMEPGSVYPVDIRTNKFSVCFKKGERVRFTITSSAVNFVFPNSNTKAGFNSTEYRTAVNTIHYGNEYPSCVVLNKE